MWKIDEDCLCNHAATVNLKNPIEGWTKRIRVFSKGN